MYALADCNNFFVSCERLFRPDLNGRPVIVLSNNDGCAIARSNEAKALGIGMGAPLFKIADIVRRNHVVVFSGNMALYGDISRRVQQTLMEFTPAIERYSIDEAFLDLRGMETADFDALAKEISRRCLRNTGIPVSVGIAPTKTLAKIASKLCKRYPKLRGGCYMYRPEDVEKVLRRFPVEDVWGIGRRFSKRLIELGIKTAYDFTTLSPEWVRAQMSVTGMRTWRELRGEACIGFEDGFQAKQSICTSRSFATEIYEFDALAEQVAKFASMTAEKLRRQHSACNQMTVFAWTNRFKEDWTSNRGNSCVTAFETATDSSIETPCLRDLCPRLRIQESGRYSHLDNSKGWRSGQPLRRNGYSAPRPPYACHGCHKRTVGPRFGDRSLAGFRRRAQPAPAPFAEIYNRVERHSHRLVVACQLNTRNGLSHR